MTGASGVFPQLVTSSADQALSPAGLALSTGVLPVLKPSPVLAPVGSGFEGSGVAAAGALAGGLLATPEAGPWAWACPAENTRNNTALRKSIANEASLIRLPLAICKRKLKKDSLLVGCQSR